MFRFPCAFPLGCEVRMNGRNSHSAPVAKTRQIDTPFLRIRSRGPLLHRFLEHRAVGRELEYVLDAAGEPGRQMEPNGLENQHI